MYAAIAAASCGTRPERQGNADAAFYHQGVYPTKGKDRWIALSLATVSDWRALCGATGIDPAAEGADRDARLAAWTAGQEETALMQALQSWGIAAGALQDVQDLLERDPQLAFRGALVNLDHPLLGPFGHVRTPLSFSRSRIEPYRAPRLGEHTDTIAQQAGLSSERIAELRALGAFK
jgi:crotonobetainyl-CoA:carnitine CoA-transferase CaiB-like acyl-CoA transferase